LAEALEQTVERDDAPAEGEVDRLAGAGQAGRSVDAAPGDGGVRRADSEGDRRAAELEARFSTPPLAVIDCVIDGPIGGVTVVLARRSEH
jgi:hypothetical protein